MYNTYTYWLTYFYKVFANFTMKQSTYAPHLAEGAMVDRKHLQLYYRGCLLQVPKKLQYTSYNKAQYTKVVSLLINH